MMRLTFVALLVFSEVGYAAPVPPPPRLTERALSGEWNFTLSRELSNIRLVLKADGTYTEQYTDPGAVLPGRWWIKDGWVVLETVGGSQVRFTLDPATFTGVTPTGWKVSLSKLAPS